MKRPRAILSAVVVAVALAVALASGAFAHPRFPVIGCNNLRHKLPNHDSWRFAPTGMCETSGSLGTLEGIDHAHWRDWGAVRSVATGDLVDGLGYEYPATITAYDMGHCHQCFGKSDDTISWYRRLHVVTAGGYRGGAQRGPFDVTIDVTPTIPSS